MKAFLKADPSRSGEIVKVFCLEDGQKRLSVLQTDGVSSIEGNVELFEIVEDDQT